MLLPIAISVFLGLLAALVLATLFSTLKHGVIAWFEIRAELALIDRGPRPAALPLRQPQAAFALLAA